MRNGAGVYNLVTNTWFPPINGVLATSSDWTPFIQDIASALTQSVSNDGQTTMIGNLPMGNNKITGLQAGTANTDAVSLGQLNTFVGQAGSAGYRNLLINGNLAINQRVYVSGAATVGANQYTLDRWRVVTSGQNITFAAGTPDRVVTCPAGGLEQVVEGAGVAGGVYTLSWTGTATAKVNGVAITNGGNTGVLPANTDTTIQFASGTVTRAQFEIGSSATPFERRPLGLEFSLCQRYCIVLSGVGAPIGSGVMFNSTTPFIAGFLPCQMRVAPTIAVNFAAAGFSQVTNGLVSDTGQAISNSTAGPFSFGFNISSSTTQVANAGVFVFLKTSGQSLTFSAEL